MRLVVFQLAFVRLWNAHQRPQMSLLKPVSLPSSWSGGLSWLQTSLLSWRRASWVTCWSCQRCPTVWSTTGQSSQPSSARSLVFSYTLLFVILSTLPSAYLSRQTSSSVDISGGILACSRKQHHSAVRHNNCARGQPTCASWSPTPTSSPSPPSPSSAASSCSVTRRGWSSSSSRASE